MDFDFDEARLSLGRRLRSLRREAGLTGLTAASLTNISQSKISKIETGRLTPTVEDVQAIAQAVGVSSQVTAELVDLTRALSTQVRSWRAMQRQSLSAHQKRASDLESRASDILVFQNSLVPGLLQVPEYARQVFLRTGLAEDESALANALAARLNRQALLFDSSKQFVFILTEAALRYRICNADVMQAQYDRLISVSSLQNVRFGVLPFDVEMPVLPLHNFGMFDRESVQIEMVAGEVIIQDRGDIQLYIHVAERFSECALFNEEAIPFLRQLAGELIGRRE